MSDPYDSVGALRNKTSESWDGKPSELDTEIQKEDSAFMSSYKTAAQEGDPSVAVVLAGEGVGEIDAIEPAYDIIQRIDEEAQQVIQSMSSILGETSKRKRN